jgi:uroporphyrinogen-III synthase
VVTKPELLRDVWRAADADEHAVEVTVSRLRRRLGPAGRAVRTVPRRGYRLDVA